MSTPRPPSPWDIMGVPTLPPGPITQGTNRMRSILGRLHKGMAPPPLRILESLFGILEHRALVALCEAGVPDALTRRTTVADLATRLNLDPGRLERLVRFGSTRGWLRIDRRGRVRPTRVTAFLRTDHPGGWRAWVEFAGGREVTTAISALSASREPTDVFASSHGAPFFEWMAAHPQRGEVFDRTMAAGGRMHALALAAALDWSGDRRVCDVGGGTGALASTLIDLIPGLDVTVMDLPAVIARAEHHHRMATHAGDAFTHVPSGFDTYLLVNVLHDWNDHDAVRMLSQVARAATPTARVVVVEHERTVVPRDGLAVATDLMMAAVTNGGYERTTAGFTRLGQAAGLRHHKAVRLASGDLAHVFEPT
jgi:SAM-dependent methyltransferase